MEDEEEKMGREETFMQTDSRVDADGGAGEPHPEVVAAATFSLDVTPAELEAATFAGAAEKVVFRQALADMDSPREAVRFNAARKIERIRHPLSVRALAARFARESSAHVREECLNTLARLKLKEGLPVMERALVDTAAAVRLAAVRGIYRLAGPAGITALMPMLADENEDVRRRTATCLGWLGPEHLAVKLLPLLADNSTAVRSAALEAMANLRSRQVVPAVVELLDDAQAAVRKKASDALHAIAGKPREHKLPEDKGSRQRLIARWRAWWEEESRCQRP